MQPRGDFHDLVKDLVDDGFTFEAFTNGTLPFDSWVLELFHLNLDWKLRGSGEDQTFRQVRWKNAMQLKSTDFVKFTIKDGDDFTEAVHVWREMWSENLQAQVLIAPVWDPKDVDAPMTYADIVKDILRMKLPWRFSMQTHKMIWEPFERGV